MNRRAAFARLWWRERNCHPAWAASRQYLGIFPRPVWPTLSFCRAHHSICQLKDRQIEELRYVTFNNLCAGTNSDDRPTRGLHNPKLGSLITWPLHLLGRLYRQPSMTALSPPDFPPLAARARTPSCPPALAQDPSSSKHRAISCKGCNKP